MRREIRLPRTMRMALLGIGVLVFAIGSFVPNKTGGILSLVSGLLVVFLFLFTSSSSSTSKTDGDDAIGKKEENRKGDAQPGDRMWLLTE